MIIKVVLVKVFGKTSYNAMCVYKLNSLKQGMKQKD